MPQRKRLTNNSDETDIAALVSGDTIFSIPYFQRPYKWGPARIDQLNKDILNLVDESSDFHFLGAVIVHGRRSNPSDPDVFDVIDGQQRIISLFLYLCSTVKLLTDLKEYEEALALFFKYLVINRDTGALSNIKIHTSKEDRKQLNNVFLDITSNKKFKAKLGGGSLKLLPSTGAERGKILQNYRLILRFLRDENEQGGIERIRLIYSALLNNMSVVQIDVWDPTNGPKIFDSLNSRQQPMTIGDLIRNEIFSRVADEHPDVIEAMDSNHWQPFYKKFDVNEHNLFDGYFFPFGLIKNPNLKKSEVYSSLRKEWDGIQDPEKIIAELAEYQDAFIDIHCGTNHSKLPSKVHGALSRLTKTGLPSSILPFLMRLCRAAADEKIGEKTAIAILSVVESFLVRRATCGHEPTGLHAVFKKLWTDCDGEYSPERVIMEISKHKTVVWPTNEEFETALCERSLAATRITPFLILEYDRSLKGDTPMDIPWIEHVLPSNPDPRWYEIFSREQHGTLKDRIANLIPLSSEMNRSLSNKPYIEKRNSYAKESMFVSARRFAEEVTEWTPEALADRGKKIASWAVSRWPDNRGQ